MGQPKCEVVRLERRAHKNVSLNYMLNEHMLTCYSAVTAVYKGTKKAAQGQILLRSYDSRKETAVEPNATIWQAGRATCATALAFKPIQIGQSVFLDEGAGKYNPAPQILDEAVCNEWPGREVGVFVSVGTGKRPEGTNQQQHLWWEGFIGGGMGDFAEARRRLISKIEDCERTHQSMKEHLAKRQVNPEHYYRLNVSVGVGEFGMNEWNRLSDISTSTRMYLAEEKVQSQNIDAAAKLARIHRAKLRWERMEKNMQSPTYQNPWERPLPNVPDAPPFAIELPAEEVHPDMQAHYQHHPAMLSPTVYPPSPRRTSDPRRHSHSDSHIAIISSDEYPQPVSSDMDPRHSGEFHSHRRSAEQFSTGVSGGMDSLHSSPRLSFEDRGRQSPPPLPPKTPLQTDRKPATPAAPMHPPPVIPPAGCTLPPAGSTLPRPPMGVPLPYPAEDGPPPVVNKARKPEFTR